MTGPRPQELLRENPIESIGEMADALAASPRSRAGIAHRAYQPGAPATWSDPEPPLSPEVRAALAAAGIERLWSHQGEALTALARGEHVLTVTPTASGKSLIYVIPTLQAIASGPATRALYLFPYKALEQDQLGSLQGLTRSAGLADIAAAAIYDGDTPAPERKKLRASPPNILITNPDMLHLGLLAYHDAWRELFSNLRYVVVDELHVYRGIFGSHFHHVMRRLARVCRRHGSSPRFIVSSATIGNPGELATSLLGVPFRVIDRSGAPRSGRHFLFVNPAGASPYTTALHLLQRCLRAGFRTIAFTKARRITELLASWLAGTAPDLTSRVASYRAGYLPEERRVIERGLASGKLLGVIATSALEHGIDIGGLDVCILVGYPGSITSSWQRIGRVGREDRESLVALVALPDALDQYFMANPEEFFDRGFERAAADPANPTIASQHLVCAGAEIPITRGDETIYSPEQLAQIEPLTRSGALLADAYGEAWYSLRRNPQRDVSLRSIGAGYTIVGAASGKTIGTVDGLRAYAECHKGAIYLHQGRQFEVEELDLSRRRAVVRQIRSDYYTQVLSQKETEILQVLGSRETPGYRVSLGRLRVTQEFTQYEQRRIADQQRMASFPLDLPPVVFETVGLWWEIPESIRESAARAAHHFLGSIHASEHAAISLFPLLAICDRGDIGGISYPSHPQTGSSTVFIYDGYPGGIGLAAKGFDQIDRLLGMTRSLIAACPCEAGCPSCVQSPKCGSGNHPLDKAGALYLLEELTGVCPDRAPVQRAPAIWTPLLLGDPAPAIVSGPALPVEPARDPGARVIFFDLETRHSAGEVGGWDRVRDMRLALAVTYDEAAGQYRTYHESDVDRLILDLMSADRVVGYNVKRFDYAVLRGYRDAAFEKISTCDMLEEVYRKLGFRLKLGHLAEATLGEGKSADGLQSLEWVKQGRLDLVEEYCRKDVDVTRRLYQFGRQNRYLLFRDRSERVMRVPVGW